MGSAAYAPQQGHLPTPPIPEILPGPADAPIWSAVCEAAADFWSAVAEHELVSRGFRALAARHARAVLEGRKFAARLPK